MVVGAGTMGSGIAYSSAASGHNVTVIEQDQKLLDQGMKRVDDYVQRNLTREHINKEQAAQIQTRVKGSLDFSKACRNADLVVEAVFEDPRIKEQVFATLDKVCPKNAILASNTSSISISKIAAATNRPDKVLGLHFFNPVPTMKLVELIRGEHTSPDSVKAATNFVQTLGKTVVQSADRTGFIVNRALMPFINESVKLLEEKVASRDDIDKAFLLGTNHPMGPLQLADFIGIDVVLSTLKVLETEYGEIFTPTPLLEQMVKDGRLGRKTKKGFYDY
ncbi:MAG TPA: 3-hydroxyacyl-CoA dehydrogenase family protein [Candidatus Bathyarchaeia archaeon]|nr:3-hydroxyacyl-CoA dehydrogenase family protein [Candidatus Bathyarchaeia archaeon]